MSAWKNATRVRFLSALIAIAVLGCAKTYSPTTFRATHADKATPLPYLQTAVYADSSYMCFIAPPDRADKKLVAMGDEVLFMRYKRPHLMVSTLLDAELLFAREMRNISDLHSSVGRGTAVCRLLNRSMSRNMAWVVPTLLTLGVSNLFGAPIGSATTHLSIEVSILDDSGTQRFSYAATGEGTTYMAPYWGYDINARDLFRASHSRAFMMALRSVMDQMMKDSSAITRTLGNE